MSLPARLGPAGTIGHPGVLIEWADGKRFLIDTGMPPAQAIEFGKMLEKLLGSDPTVAYGAVHTQLGDALESVRGIAFTHLHSDHTAGLQSLCDKPRQAATVFLRQDRNDRPTRTWRPAIGRAWRSAGIPGPGSVPGNR